MLSYYKKLRENNGDREIKESKRRICSSQQSMCRYHVNLNLMDSSQIYNSMLSDYYRSIISRWRLSNHRLNVETGRYTKPVTKRKDRLCTLCKVLEDEEQVMFSCPRYEIIQTKYQHVINDANIQTFLSPTYANMIDTANFIYDIEKRRRELNL